ncbi:MAG TPA: hypothetical protein VIW93_12290 [Candidatus Acidoferrum sp.]
MPADDAEQIVKIVGQASGEASDGFQFLSLLDHVFQMAAFGNIPCDALHAFLAAVRTDQARAHLEKHFAPVLAQHADFKMLQRLFIDDTLHHLAAELEVFRSDQILYVYLPGFASGPSHYVFGGLVQKSDIPFEVEGEENVFGILEELMKTLLGLTGRSLGTSALNGVLQGLLEQFAAQGFLHQIFCGTYFQNAVAQSIVTGGNQGKNRQEIELRVKLPYAGKPGAV